MTDCKKFNNVTDLAGAKCDHPPHRNLSATCANAFAKMPADYDEQAKLTQQLVTAATSLYLKKRCAGKFFITLSVMKKV